ncbi:hypothetical protein J132_02648 [Termitomyces sp. J132]|nr:hypothetical protein J132_02648 [Termitomyces sp. J132]
MPGVVIGNSTRIWEVNVHWEVYSQCCMWDPRSRCVNIWECIKDRRSLYILYLSTSSHALSRRLQAWHRGLCGYLLPSSSSDHPFQPPNDTYWRYVARR